MCNLEGTLKSVHNLNSKKYNEELSLTRRSDNFGHEDRVVVIVMSAFVNLVDKVNQAKWYRSLRSQVK